MAVQLPNDISDLLESVVKENISHFDLKIHDGNKTGSGLLGDMTFVSLKNKKTGELKHFVVKQVLPSKNEATSVFMSSIFFNEIQFYSKIWPAYQEFHRAYPQAKILDNIPKCYGFTHEKGKEKLILENLKILGYEMHPKPEAVGFQMYRDIFEVFGKLHGLSFAYKHHCPNNFFEMGRALPNNWVTFKDAGVIGTEITAAFNMVKKILADEGEDKLSQKLDKYFKNAPQLYSDGSEYNGPNAIILHGDCWSNNIMFKFNEKRELEHLKFVDYQMSYLGTPVLDLQYSLYSGATKETLDKLEELLQTYHNSLSGTMEQYGCEPEKIYPYRVLKREWKAFIDFGFIMGILMWVAKTDDTFGQQKMNEAMDGDNSDATKGQANMMTVDEKRYKPRALDLIRHVIENDFL